MRERERERKVLWYINFHCGIDCVSLPRHETKYSPTTQRHLSIKSTIFSTFIRCTIFSIECKLCSKHILHEIAIILTVSTRSMLYWNIYLLQHKWAAVKDERIYDTSNEMTTTMDSDNLTILWPLKCHRRRLFRNWFFSHFIFAVFSSSSFCSS